MKHFFVRYRRCVGAFLLSDGQSTKYKKYPKLIDVMENRHIMYNETTSYIREKEKLPSTDESKETKVNKPKTNNKRPSGRFLCFFDKLFKAY